MPSVKKPENLSQQRSISLPNWMWVVLIEQARKADMHLSTYIRELLKPLLKDEE